MRGNEPAFVDVLAGFVATGSELSTRLREPIGAADLDEVRLTLDGLGPARVESIEPIAGDGFDREQLSRRSESYDADRYRGQSCPTHDSRATIRQRCVDHPDLGGSTAEQDGADLGPPRRYRRRGGSTTGCRSQWFGQHLGQRLARLTTRRHRSSGRIEDLLQLHPDQFSREHERNHGLQRRLTPRGIGHRRSAMKTFSRPGRSGASRTSTMS